jgi:hypothetical protein
MRGLLKSIDKRKDRFEFKSKAKKKLNDPSLEPEAIQIT